MQTKLSLTDKGLAIANTSLETEKFIDGIVRAFQAENWFKYGTDELAAAMGILIEQLQLADHNLTNFALGTNEAKLASDRMIMSVQMYSTAFQILATAMSQAIMMGIMFNTMDLKGPMKWLMMVNAAISAITMGLMVASAYMNFFKGAAVAPTPAGAIAAGTLAAGGMLAAMWGTYHLTKGEWDVESASMEGKLAELEKQYTSAPVTDTGMFASNRRTYDEGGTIGPRHQLVYVEPGEQIISKTQGMVGMGGANVTVNIGEIYAEDGTDFADKLAEALPRALRRTSYAGGF